MLLRMAASDGCYMVSFSKLSDISARNNNDVLNGGGKNG